MSARLRLLLLVALALPALALAKNAEDYFHSGSYKYVAGKRQDALLEVEEGLRKFPEDARLKALAAQLRKLDDTQKNSGNGGQDKKDKDKKDPGKDKDKKEDEKKKDDGKDKQDKKEKPDEKQPPRDKDEGKDDGKNGKNPAGGRPGEMSREEAQRLLNSFAEDEKKEQRERQKLMRKRLETEQDW